MRCLIVLALLATVNAQEAPNEAPEEEIAPVEEIAPIDETDAPPTNAPPTVAPPTNAPSTNAPPTNAPTTTAAPLSFYEMALNFRSNATIAEEDMADLVNRVRSRLAEALSVSDAAQLPFESLCTLVPGAPEECFNVSFPGTDPDTNANSPGGPIRPERFAEELQQEDEIPTWRLVFRVPTTVGSLEDIRSKITAAVGTALAARFASDAEFLTFTVTDPSATPAPTPAPTDPLLTPVPGGPPVKRNSVELGFTAGDLTKAELKDAIDNLKEKFAGVLGTNSGNLQFEEACKELLGEKTCYDAMYFENGRRSAERLQDEKAKWTVKFSVPEAVGSVDEVKQKAEDAGQELATTFAPDATFEGVTVVPIVTTRDLDIDDDDELSGSAIAGIVIGVVLFCGLIAAVALIVVKGNNAPAAPKDTLDTEPIDATV